VPKDLKVQKAATQKVALASVDSGMGKSPIAVHLQNLFVRRGKEWRS